MRLINFQEVIIRPIRQAEIGRWSELMRLHHYLGYKGIAGKSLRYVAEYQGEWLALIGWGSGALKCNVRDIYIGWSPEQQYKRLHYIVNNVRFLILPGVNIRNLASRVLSINLKRISADFEAAYGHPVYLAETFVDESRYLGTCYKASNWRHLGYSSGYSKRHMSYYRTGKRKAVYVFPLHKEGEKVLSGDFIPYDLNLVLKQVRLSVLQDFPIDSLLEEIRSMRDPRQSQGLRHPLETVLAISLCAVICGCRGFRAIGEWAGYLTVKDLRRFGSNRDRPPSEPSIRRVLHRIDAVEFDRKIYGWLLKQKIIKGEGIAIDGKTLRGSRDGEKRGRHLLSAVIHKEGVVIAQDEVDEKTNEIKHVKPLFEDVDIAGSVVTADALLTQREVAKYIVEEKNADYLFVAKGNQKTLMEDIKNLELEKKTLITKR